MNVRKKYNQKPYEEMKIMIGKKVKYKKNKSNTDLNFKK